MKRFKVYRFTVFRFTHQVKYTFGNKSVTNFGNFTKYRTFQF